MLPTLQPRNGAPWLTCWKVRLALLTALMRHTLRLSGACLPATECARRAGYSEWVAKKATFIIERAPLVALVLKEHRRREDEEFKQLVEQL